MVTSRIVSESPAARRFRLIVPLVVLLALAVLAITPGLIVYLTHDPVPAGQERSDLASR